MSLLVTGLRIEHAAGPSLGVHTATPRLSWRTETDAAGWVQSAYEIEATGWSSARVESRDCVLVPWGGAALASRDVVSWRVRVWGADGSESPWSEPGSFEVGLLSPADWSASAIAPAWEEDTSCSQPAALLRRSFPVVGDVVRARLHATALGTYEATLNGRRIGDHELAPGWTAYEQRLHVQTFDVTDLVVAGGNELGALLSDGWWRGALGFTGGRNTYGERTAFVAQLEMELADGTVQRIVTDDSWEATTGPVRAGDLYDGETYDARIDPGPWSPVRPVPLDLGTLVPQPTPPVRLTETVRPVDVTTSPTGRTIVDFGQNLVGVVRLRVEGPAGTTITLRHAEVLEDGEVCTRILRLAKATDRYTLRGDGIEEWRPTTTFHGFRYLDVEGWPGTLTVDHLEALVLHSDMERTGWFECSNELVNQLHRNIVWGWRGNTVAVPTDCPQRDERLGWTGDLQVFAPTACFLTDAAGFLDGWLADLAAEQLPNGCVPAVIPNLFKGHFIYGAGWGDAATVVPDVVHEWYGDEGLLRRQLPSMQGWVDSITERTGTSRLWNDEWQYGDWVDPTVDPLTPGSGRTDTGFIATAYYARSADRVATAAELLGETGIGATYRALAAEIRDAFRHEYVSPSGRVVADTQAGCALALVFDLVEEQHREIVGRRLHHLVGAERHRLATGFLGTPVLAPALTQAGYLVDAYQLLLNEDAPGWLYPVLRGATTIWERWDAIRPDGTINPGSDMLSFNHYALGAIGEWLHGTVGGLVPLEPGFRRFRVAPQPGIGISSATTTFDSRYGRIESRWAVAGRGLDLTVTVPPNTSASVVPPGLDGTEHGVGSGTHRWRYGVSEETYRSWVDFRFSMNTPIGEIRADPAAWAIVEEHGGPIAARYRDDVAHLSLREVASITMAGLLQPVLDRLTALDTAPAEPDPIRPT